MRAHRDLAARDAGPPPHPARRSGRGPRPRLGHVRRARRGRAARGRAGGPARHRGRGDDAQRGDGAAGGAPHLVRPSRLATGRAARPLPPAAPRGGRPAAGARSPAGAPHHRTPHGDRGGPRRDSRAGSARRWSSCRCATPAASSRRGTSWSSSPRRPARAASPCTSTAPGCGSHRPPTTGRSPRSWPCSTASTSRSTRASARCRAPPWPPTRTPRRSCACGAPGWAAR